MGIRGLAGTILAYKVASALSDQGADLDAVEKVTDYVARRLGTLGIGLDHCHVRKPVLQFRVRLSAPRYPELAPVTLTSELTSSNSYVPSASTKLTSEGMGIHNEPGTDKLHLPKTSELVSTMLKTITDTTDPDRSFVSFKGDGSDEVVLLVNCLGAISQLEMSGITNEGKRSHVQTQQQNC